MCISGLNKQTSESYSEQKTNETIKKRLTTKVRNINLLTHRAERFLRSH
jgi:hypothetical protein